MRSAEIQLTEAILTAHAVTVSGRSRLQDIQRQLIEAINNPVTALDTPAGERQFLLFLRSKIAEIQDIVDTGALTDEDHAKLTRALGSGYLLPDSERAENVRCPPQPSAGAPMADQAAGMMPALGSALGRVAAGGSGRGDRSGTGCGRAGGSRDPAGGLGVRAARARRRTRSCPRTASTTSRRPTSHARRQARETEADDEAEDSADDRRSAPQPPGDREPPEDGPAQTRPARRL